MQLSTRRVTPVTDALVTISKLRFFPFHFSDTPCPLNHSRCLLQKLPKSAEGSREGAEPGGVADRWQLQGQQQRGIKGRNTRELCFRESVSLDDSKVHFNPAQPAFLPPRAAFSAGPATTVANVSPVPCRTQWPPRWTHLSQVELPPPSVTVQKMDVLFAVPGNSWVSKSKAQHGFKCSSPMTFLN